MELAHLPRDSRASVSCRLIVVAAATGANAAAAAAAVQTSGGFVWFGAAA